MTLCIMKSIIFWDVTPERTTRRHIPEDVTLHNHHWENLKSYTIYADYATSADK
jgi:hypothetical protein